MRKTTVRDVAKYAGVAVGTVSRVLNRNATVNPELRQRVEDAIRRLDYASPPTRSEIPAGAPTISFVLSNRRFLHPVHARILQGVEEYCRDLGYLVLYTSFQYPAETPWNELALPRVLTEHGIADCLILVGMNYDNLLVALEKAEIPYVYGGNKAIVAADRAPVDRIRWDERAAGVEATRYLLQLGHKRIAYIGDISLPWYRAPYEGYLTAMREAGLKPIAQTVALAADPFDNGQLNMELLLEKDRSVTGLFADSNVVYGAWAACRNAGIQVPQNMSLVALGEQYGMLTVPPVTSVSLDMTLFGRTAARMAVQRFQEKQQIPEIVLSTALIPRGTCRPVDPQEVEQALTA